MSILNKLKEERGAAVVEFAIVVPLLLMLLFGIIDFGVLIYDKAMLTNASREAARAGIVAGLSGEERLAQIEAAAQRYLYNDYPSNTGLMLITFAGTQSDPQILTSANLGALTFGDDLTVTVRYPFKFLIIPAFVTSIIDSDRTIEASTTMRVE
ncbi:MAG: TadE/TadG family type IV pilus assembly protein [Desulfuromonadales bacterium]|nr:TadE/TadG family type IV pilus assembly protein [Desulfuromonadales bacterium]MDW7758140.1 TadE/TadG family type IV pilus assembly protein [Desulfuromonadales bacterium]